MLRTPPSPAPAKSRPSSVQAPPSAATNEESELVPLNFAAFLLSTDPPVAAGAQVPRLASTGLGFNGAFDESRESEAL
jgi:hypothetical protein